MRKINFFFVMLLFNLFIPNVYAFTYEVDASVSDTLVNIGTELEIKISLKNIQGTSDGIASCSLNILFDNNVVLNSRIRTLGSWTMTTGKFYLFDTGETVIDDTEFFIVPIKINGEGSVKLVDIICSDGNTNSNFSDKVINFNILNDEWSDNQLDNTLVEKDSNCDLTNIELNEGTIEFEPSITEYSIDISSFDDLVVSPILDSATSSYSIERRVVDGTKSLIITVNAQNGNTKKYTIYVNEISSSNLEEKKSIINKYTPIFVVIIVVLVIINIIRMILSRKK